MRYDLYQGDLLIASFASAAEVGASRLAGLVPDGTAVVAAPSADDVRAECQRRIHLVLGARDQEHALVIQTRAHEEAIRILDKKSSGEPLAADEQAAAARFRAVQAELAVLRAASNAMEASPPADFAADARWAAGS